MQLINSGAKFISQDYSLDGIYKHIEKCSRTCYKSEDKIIESSSTNFVNRMINNKHLAMLEHGTVYLKIDDATGQDNNDLMLTLTLNPYTKNNTHDNVWYITTNLRVIIENELSFLLKYICEPTKYHEKRYSVKCTTDRGVSHELVRHKIFLCHLTATLR